MVRNVRQVYLPYDTNIHFRTFDKCTPPPFFAKYRQDIQEGRAVAPGQVMNKACFICSHLCQSLQLVISKDILAGILNNMQLIGSSFNGCLMMTSYD